MKNFPIPTLPTFGIIVALLLSILSFIGLNERWGLNILEKREAVQDTAVLPSVLPQPQGGIIEASGIIKGSIKSIDPGLKQITLDLSYGLAQNELIVVSFSGTTHFWEAAIQRADPPSINNFTGELPLIYYPQPSSIEKLKSGDILRVEVKEWHSIAPPETRVEAESVGIFEKVSSATKEYLRTRYGPVAEKIESY